MTSANRPSIFTPRDIFPGHSARQPPAIRSGRAPRTSSPFSRRQITPLNPATARPVDTQASVAPAHTYPDLESSNKEGELPLPATDILPSPVIWRSFANPRPGDSESAESANASSDRGAEEVGIIPATPISKLPQPSAESSASAKRKAAAISATQIQISPVEPASKRYKLRRKSHHTLDAVAFGPPSFTVPDHPPSPLFFSNSPQPRPSLPPRFSSGEAAARMLSKARVEDSYISRVSLPFGTITMPGSASSNPPSVPSATRRSLERGGTGRSTSPDVVGNGAREGLGPALNSIGIIELLDQDERPTMIVDLGDSSNYGAGPLQPVFTNPALRSYEGLHALACGLTPDDHSPGPRSFLQFKSWLLSAAVNGESLNVCLPPFVHAGITWSCSTFRKRLRIISGAFNSPPSTAASAAMRVSVPPSDTENETTLLETVSEPSDYFGQAAHGKVNAISDGSSSTVTEAVPTIEASFARGECITPQLLAPRFDLSGVTDMLPARSSTYVCESPKNGDSHRGSPGSSRPNSGGHSDESTANAVSSDSQIAIVRADAPSFDWTRLPVSDNMPPHIRFARSIDWAATSLGPIENWSADLRQMCNLIMASPHPAAMYWGDDLIAIYNEAYILLAGQKHPSLMGMSYREAWAEIWHEVEEVFDSAKRTGEATMKDDDCLFIRRSDWLEETYFSWSIIPMVGQDGSVMGLYNPAFEKTRRKIAERRMLTLREVGEKTATARDLKAFWSQVLGSFEFNEFDSPFLLLYSVTDESDSDSSSMHSNSILASRQCTLEGSLGIPEGHVAAPDQIDLKTGTSGFGPVFREVMNTDRPLLLEVGTADLPASLMEGLDFRGFGDPVRAVVVCPIHPTTGENVLGFLVLGVNPRRAYDDDYSLFVQLLSRQLATSLASVVLFEEEIRRGQKAAQLAALDRIELSEQLAARTQEAIESETKFTRMAEFAPVGMFIANSEGKITFANDTWYEISQVPKGVNMADHWMDAVNDEDTSSVRSLWKTLVVDKLPVSGELRFKAQWNRNGNRGETWALFSGYPEKYEDGRLKSIFGSITDISQQKWAEGIQTRKMEEAVELKRQQENFIDITSHEMRNPLSAILQCSDEISTSLTRFRQSDDKVISDEIVASCLDAAQTINLCSQHQKRIVDDILTLSKLDSQLLLVTPVDTQPLTVVQRALKMHEGELQAADIQMKFVVDRSFRDLKLDWVRCDPSRVLQVLINLTTNAIKFTGTESKRTITVTIAASTERPGGKQDALVQYFPTRSKNRDTMSEQDWGDGEKVYIHFAVSDTGRGLSPEEKKLLFIRFSQASPRTHVQYGGSGLGLFISRELTELQGGEIGVESAAGKGSTFAFYIAARRSTGPPDGGDVMKTPSPHPTSVARRQAAAAKAAGNQPANAPAAPHQAAAGIDKPRAKRVLIVEDNLVNQRVLQKQLRNLGTEVHLANHGGEALEKLRQSTFWQAGSGSRIGIDVVLMDQEMPVMDGLTCTRKIRELEAEGKLTGHVPIIAVTANARAEQVQTALDAGMDDVVSKPFRIPELVPKIEELMLRYPVPR